MGLFLSYVQTLVAPIYIFFVAPIYFLFIFVFVFECIAAEISIRFERSTCKEIDSCIPIYHVTV